MTHLAHGAGEVAARSAAGEGASAVAPPPRGSLHSPTSPQAGEVKEEST